MSNSTQSNYMAQYMLARYHRRRREAVEALGGCCQMCGSTKRLELDHKDPSTKSFDIAQGLAGYSEARVAAELAKCWLLCHDCHRQKTAVEQAVQRSRRIKWAHGTLGGYRYCKCDECRDAKRRANSEYRAAHGRTP